MVNGILLAAGTGTRFGGQKLLYPLAGGTPLGVAAARNLHRAVERVIAVLRAGDTELSRLLVAEGVKVVLCKDAGRGMGASLACGVRAAREARGWLIALADMPYIRPETIQAVARLIEQGAPIAAPCYRAQRGHPVGFGPEFRDELASLAADVGARALLAHHAGRIQLAPCTDPGVVADVDTRQDLISLEGDRQCVSRPWFRL